MASVTGTFSRYGEGNNILEMSSGAAAASGMQMGQFGEFVESLKSVFENAISNGMIKGADKIAQSMVLLEKLSGGSELWKGEQGASRFLQMSDTISQATKLMSPTDILSYRAASGIAGTYLSGTGEWEKQFGSKRGGDYVDNMLILESGLSPALMLAQKKMVESVAGEGNRAGQVEQYRQMYGLNYTGAAQVYEMMGKLGTEGYGEEDITNKIEAMQKDPQYLSNELNMLKTVEDIRTEVTKTGQTMSDIKTDMMSPVKSVVGWVANKAQDNLYGDMARGATEGLFSENVKADKEAKDSMITALKKGLISGTEEELRAVWQIVNAMSALTEEQKVWGNSRDIANIDWGNINLVEAAKQMIQVVWQGNAPKGLPGGLQEFKKPFNPDIGSDWYVTPETANMFKYNDVSVDDQGENFANDIRQLFDEGKVNSDNIKVVKGWLDDIGDYFSGYSKSDGVNEEEYKELGKKYDAMKEAIENNTKELAKGITIITDNL